MNLRIPPLRERKDDLAALSAYFIDKYAKANGRPARRLSKDGLTQVLAHAWPGNVRELEHVIERAVLMARGNVIRPDDLGLRATTDPAPRLDEMSLDEVEAHLIKKTLARFCGNAQKAAEALGLSRSAFYRRLEKYGL